jgi:hypothetical protein
MSNFTFRKAVRENVGLIIGMAGESGSGKTYSALRLATGLAGGKPFCVLDTEAGRAKHYAGHVTEAGTKLEFDHGDIRAPFRPDTYAEAIDAADAAGYPVIVVDSTSHVWAGDGGVLDWQEAELDRMAGDDWKKREACKMAAWIKPKMSHKRMVQKLLQVRAHLILCFRSEPKVEIVREDGKVKVVPKQSVTGLDGWLPVCEKNLPYELTASFLLHADKPGVPRPIKLQAQHRPFVSLDQPITEDTGKALAAWASGGAKPEASTKPASAPGGPDKGGLLKALQLAGSHGMASLKADWAALTKAEQDTLNAAEFQALKKAAKEADTP